jgi:hypothetical protein
LLYASPVFQTQFRESEMANLVMVVFDNTKSETDLYITLNRADGPWLTLGAESCVWQNNFDSSCQVLVSAGSNYVFPFPEYSGAYGARFYMATQSMSGVPDLTTAPFVFDKVEMGWNAVWNQTSVDFFGIPVQIQVDASAPYGYADNVTRNMILEQLLTLPAPYNSFVYPVGATDPDAIYRIFSPGQASSMTAAPWNYNLNNCLGQNIATGMTALTANSPTGFNYGGFVMSAFAKQSDSTMTVTVNSESVTLSNVTTAGATACTIQASPNDAAGQKAAGLIGAVINRGVLGNYSQWGQSGYPNAGYPQFYYVPGSANANQVNNYAQALHAQSLNGLCYAMPYDDFFGQDAAMTVNGGSKVRITVLPMGSGVPCAEKEKAVSAKGV